MTQRVTQRTGCLAATCGHVTSVTSLLPYRGKAGSCSPVYPINIDFLSYKIHLAKNLEHFGHPKHLDLCHHWLRNAVTTGMTCLLTSSPKPWVGRRLKSAVHCWDFNRVLHQVGVLAELISSPSITSCITHSIHSMLHSFLFMFHLIIASIWT